jgi:hypothetical protein
MRKEQEKKGGNGDSENAGDVFGNILEAVSGRLARPSGGPADAGAVSLGAVTEVVQSAVRGAAEKGNNLVMGAKAIVVGVLRGTGEKEEAALGTLSHTARTVVHQAAALGTDLAACTKGLVLGAIACARDVGVDRGRAASVAAQGALDGARDADSAAVDKVRDALREAIGGVTVGLPAPLQK